MARRRTSLQIFLAVLALVLLGTVVVLSSISFYLSIDQNAYLSEDEVGYPDTDATWNASQAGLNERIPRILHQTWKTETLPDRWKDISQQCRDMMPDYEYMLWTDADSREFIAKEYPWFLDTFDSYTYPIQRADAIRYFVLYHYGGVYLDLDVGCRRRLDRLLVYPVILPKTIPVGVSNDLMFSEKHHPFMEQTIHNLITFDHSWVLNYPTVMFSTGPMFLSAQYGFWRSAHSPTADMPGGEVRILPKPLYGKNAKPEEAPHAFFSHYYGSSWHADDAAFIGFLGKWGKGLMLVGFVLLVFGMVNLLWKRKGKRCEGLGPDARVDGYEVLVPRSYQQNGRWHIDLGLFTLTTRSATSASTTSSVASSCPSTPTAEENVPMLPISFDVRSPSPASSESSTTTSSSILHSNVRRPYSSNFMDAIFRAGNQVITTISGGNYGNANGYRSYERPRGRLSWRRDSNGSRDGSNGVAGSGSTNGGRRGVLFFLPAIFTPNAMLPTSDPAASASRSRRTSQTRLAAPTPVVAPGSGSISATAAPAAGNGNSNVNARYPPEKVDYTLDLEAASIYGHPHHHHPPSPHSNVYSSPHSHSHSSYRSTHASVPSSSSSSSSAVPPPPPYPSTEREGTENAGVGADSDNSFSSDRPTPSWSADGNWEEWEAR